MAEKKEVKKRNVAIEFWRFFAAIAITGFHVGWIIARSCNESTGYYMETSNWFFGASEVLLLFTITAGYFMVAHYKKLAKDPKYNERSAMARAGEYTWSRIKGLIPVLILGYILGIIFSTKFFYPDYGLKETLGMIVNSIWEFLGFHAAGLRNTGGEFFNLNGPLWFISAIVIVGYFIYWGLCKNEDKTAGFVAPLLTIFLAGWWSFTDTRAAQTAWSTFGTQLASTNGMGGSATGATATVGFNNGLIFVMLGMLIGVIMYYVIEKLKEREFKCTWCLTLINLVCTVLLAWYIIYQPTYFGLQRWPVAFLCIMVVGLSILNKDGLTKALNNKSTNSTLSYLGGLSLYVYMIHFPIAILILRCLGKNSPETIYSFWQVFIPTVIISICLSVIVKYVMEKTILKKN
ncbi:MAG: acyltransferase [Bacilli bacterium]|nr:acyltransferase [Bacilli bacterium]